MIGASGAIGGATSALLANQISSFVTDGQGNPSPAQLAAITALSMLAGGGVAAALGQNAVTATNAAQNEVLNNTCAPGHDCGTLKSAAKDSGKAAVNTVLGLIEAVPNAFSGALPGYPDYVPFMGGARLAYDDPDFGQTLEFLAALGIAKASSAGATNSGTTTLYRAVGPAELSDIQNDWRATKSGFGGR